ncbi:helix-turn-helix transcriptional regulator [Paraburkholderia phymatum]|uniref:helix-turn-helix transcriptional regulator n=1 Tax=Paraburkholderia phymatum TaxID=148447 RepID=UPI003177A4D3
MTWKPIHAPRGLVPPKPLAVRAQSIPARHYFPEHAHGWNQMVYASSGVLTVIAGGRSFVTSPEQAVWLPTGVHHRVGSLLGAEFRSLWIADDVSAGGVGVEPTVFGVTPLLKELVVEAASISEMADDDGYAGRVTHLILDQLRRAHTISAALPWPRDGVLSALCETLYTDPADPRGPEAWSAMFGMSTRTLARHFVTETGMSLRSWRRRMRLFRAIELLGGGLGVTRTAMELGYGSTSAFVYAFRLEMGTSPQAYMRQHADRASVRLRANASAKPSAPASEKEPSRC